MIESFKFSLCFCFSVSGVCVCVCVRARVHVHFAVLLVQMCFMCLLLVAVYFADAGRNSGALADSGK